MLSLTKPDASAVRRFLDQQQGLDFTYEGVGGTASQPTDGYVRDHTRIKLGTGESTFTSSKSALASWQQFQLGWIASWPPETPIQKDETIAIVARAAGLWWLNACRIVYVVDDDQPVRRFGFAYGTLPEHVGSGEERFLVEIDQHGDVYYDVLAFSRPRHPLARMAYPLMRNVQKRFGRESAKAMQDAIEHSSA